jgi:hypothetical protein
MNSSLTPSANRVAWAMSPAPACQTSGHLSDIAVSNDSRPAVQVARADPERPTGNLIELRIYRSGLICVAGIR